MKAVFELLLVWFLSLRSRRRLAVWWHRDCTRPCRHGYAHWREDWDPNSGHLDIRCARCGALLWFGYPMFKWCIPASHPGFRRLS